MVKYLLLFILLIIVVNVWLVNYRRRRKQIREPIPLTQERQLAQIDVDNLTTTSRGLLTTKRVFRDSNSWVFSRRRSQSIQLEDLHSVSWRVELNLWSLLFGAFLIGLYSPFGLLLVLYALQTPITAVGFQSHYLPGSFFHSVGLGVSRSHIVFRSGNRAYYPQLRRFYEAGVAAWSRVRHREAPDQLSETAMAQQSPAPVPFFAWTGTVWAAVGAVFLAAHLQRILTGHVVVDHPLFGALYLGLPLAVAFLEGRRNGLWAALLTFLMLLAVKFPAGLLLGFVLNDGSLHFGELLGIFVATLLIVLVGGFIHERQIPLPGEAAILVIWPLSLLLLDPGSVLSFRSLALVLTAAAASRLAALAIPSILRSSWLERTKRLIVDLVDFIWSPA